MSRLFLVIPELSLENPNLVFAEIVVIAGYSPCLAERILNLLK